MTSSRRWLAPLFTAALVLTHCAGSGTDQPAPGEFVSSDKARELSPDAPAEDLAALVTGNTEFGISLYWQAVKPGENLLFSPFSISQGLTMVYAGARGQTEAEMAQTLHFPLSQARLHPATNALNLKLDAQAEQSAGGEGTPTQLRRVNATWGQKGLAFEPTFLDVLALHHGTGMRVVDFPSGPSAIRKGINRWVEEQTEGRIQGLLPEGAITSDTRLMLVNALYFKGEWEFPFEPELTRGAPFHLLEGGTREVQMMRGPVWADSMRGEGFEAVGLPFVKGTYRMLFIVPEQGRFAEVESRLSAGFLAHIRSAQARREVLLGLPRFQVKQSFSLAQALKDLGMAQAFTQRADFSGLTQQEKLSLESLSHSAFVSVDEQGTEAAAATAVGAGAGSIPEPLTLDRPFLFLIEDAETRTVLFLGRFVKP
jgi:serpin B